MLPGTGIGQAPSEGSAPLPVHAEVVAGGELERYLRMLQVTGDAERYPWSIRAFSPRDLSRLAPAESAHPWAARFAFTPSAEPGLHLAMVRPAAEMIYNSAFPHGINDGATWAGRGATVAARFGVAASWGPVSVVLAPQAFIAQNADFELAPTGYSDERRFANSLSPTGIDAPQRFGDERYGRFDPGESTLRADLKYVTFGVSTASQYWGPAVAHPIVLGNNAGGFPHAFAGTSTPLDLRIARVHGRLVWGELRQSNFTHAGAGEDRRFMSGIVTLVEPPIPGLELGFTRFYHTTWPEDGLTTDLVLAPLEAFLKENRSTGQPNNEDASNQIASVFARWALPPAGFEIYGEFGREDHSWNARDFLLEPDHISAYLAGFQKVWKLEGNRRGVLRGELLNSQVTMLEQVRGQSRFYVHSRVRQGHTARGQILGSAAAMGGGGGLLEMDLFHRGGRWTVSGSRMIRNDRPPAPTAGEPGPRGHDVLYSLHAETLMFLRNFDLTARIGGAYNLNRDYRKDVFNVNAAFGLTWHP